MEERRGFTADLWRSIDSIYAAILDHPFLTGLTDGTLPEECFRHYVLQDTLYLRDYARALSLAGVRSSGEDTLVMFNEHSSGAILVERSLHDSFLKDLGISGAKLVHTPMAPTALAYPSYLLRTASLGDYPEVLGAVLPCYWIYAEVGKALLERGSPNPMYRRWIETYGGEEFNTLVEAVLSVTDRACEDLGPSQRKQVTQAFVTTSRYEWMFWNMGWTLERWPL
ncbi:MAG: thiaminase II [Actinomycetota bacterium]|nr:thiaminase II [Actinomycetota bacterium]